MIAAAAALSSEAEPSVIISHSLIRNVSPHYEDLSTSKDPFDPLV